MSNENRRHRTVERRADDTNELAFGDVQAPIMGGGFADGEQQSATAFAIQSEQNVHALIEGTDGNFLFYINFGASHPFPEERLSGVQRGLRLGRIFVPVLGDDREYICHCTSLRALGDASSRAVARGIDCVSEIEPQNSIETKLVEIDVAVDLYKTMREFGEFNEF